MAKKYRYRVENSAEGISYGYVDLTKKEAEIVAYATNEANWKNAHDDGYSGYFIIDIDHPMEIPNE